MANIGIGQLLERRPQFAVADVVRSQCAPVRDLGAALRLEAGRRKATSSRRYAGGGEGLALRNLRLDVRSLHVHDRGGGGEERVVFRLLLRLGGEALGLGPVGAAFFLWDIGMKKGDLRFLGVASYATPMISTAPTQPSAGAVRRGTTSR